MLPTGARLLITGATSGIGWEAARQLAALRYRIILHGRTPESAHAAADAIRQVLPTASIETIAADLSSLAAVRAMAAEVRRRFDRLDVLVNNAGVITDQYTLSPDGHELTLAVNHLAPFVLTNELLPLLRVSGPARIITVSSQLHARAKLDLTDLHLKKNFSAIRAYANSKLMNLLFGYELARRLAHDPITSNCLHPGFVATQFDRHLMGSIRWAWRIGLPFATSPAQGAATTVYLASSSNVEGHSGKYYVRKHSRQSSPTSYDARLARKLWQRSAEITGVG